jgi:hypothetical protein
MVLPRHIDATREPIVEACQGCERINLEGDITYCKAYVRPAFWWSNGRYCPLAIHFKLETEKATGKVNPLKASKRAAGKKKK